MGKLFIVTIITLATAISGCVRGGITPSQSVPDYTAPIALNADIDATTQTRAAVSGSVFPANATDAFRLTAYAGNATPSDWTAAYFTNIQVNSVNSVMILSPMQYYPAAGEKLYFYAWAPEATSITAGTATDAPIANYTIDGQQDIMAAQQEAGISKIVGATQTHPALNFTHKLKQVKFTIKADDTFETGIKVTSIEVKQVKSTAKLAANSGVLTFNASPLANLVLPIVAGTNDEITKAGTVMDGCLMFEPGTTFKISVTAGGITYDDATVTLAGTNAGQAGVSHNVTLTFKRSGIVPSSTIEEWTDAGNTDVDIM